MSNYEIIPKLKFFQNGTLLKTKKQISAQRHPGVTETDSGTNMLFDKDEPVIIPIGVALLYVDNKQFYSASKDVVMSAWIRAEVVSHLGERLWVTLLQERKTIWDFKTYTGKKQLLDYQINENFHVLSMQNTKKFNIENVSQKPSNLLLAK